MIPTAGAPALSTARTALAATVGADGKVYVIGGTTASTRAANIVEMWDPVAGATSWVTRATLPIGVRSAGVATGGDGRIYVFGGENGSGPNARAFAYDPAANTWRELAMMARGRYGLASVGGGDGRVYAIGGNSGTGNVRDVQAFNPVTASWDTVGLFTLYASSARALTANDGRVVVFGGYDNLTFHRGVYSLVAGAWQSETSLPEGRAWHGVARALDGTWHVVGGETLPGLPDTAHHVYDPATRMWRTAAALPERRSNFAMVTLRDGRILAIGGETSSGTRLATVRAWSPDVWR